MNKESGVSMIELLVACVILIFVVSATVTTFVSMKQISRNLGYHYLAMNLAKEPMEFGEAANFTHQFGEKYYYAPATSNTIPLNCACNPPNHEGIDASTTGYALKEWRCFDNVPSNPQPFLQMGDIKAKGLVPAHAPDSVVIYYRSEPDPDFTSLSRVYCRETTEVSWQDEEGGEQRQVVLSVVPIRHVNDQLRLLTSEFWWE